MSGYKVYGVCPCEDFWEEAPFGQKFHIHREVCPACGTRKSKWRLVTGKVVYGKSFWRQPRLEPRETA